MAGTPIIGRVLVDAPGTPEPLSTPAIACQQVDVVALPSNTGTIVIGSDEVRASGPNAPNGIYLDAGDGFTIGRCDLAEWFIDASAAGEGVAFTAQEA